MKRIAFAGVAAGVFLLSAPPSKPLPSSSPTSSVKPFYPDPGYSIDT